MLACWGCVRGAGEEGDGDVRVGWIAGIVVVRRWRGIVVVFVRVCGNDVGRVGGEVEEKGGVRAIEGEGLRRREGGREGRKLFRGWGKGGRRARKRRRGGEGGRGGWERGWRGIRGDEGE